jgi:Fe-S cluster biogenesis protein NfuA
MAQDTALQKQIQRIGEIVEQLEATADPSVRSMAKELLESIMALHGAGLERILELASQSGEAGAAIVQKCGRDELVSSLLLLYGLHPDNLATRVARALEKSRSYLEKHGGTAELVSVNEEGEVRVRLAVATTTGCGSSASSLKSTLEAAMPA